MEVPFQWKLNRKSFEKCRQRSLSLPTANWEVRMGTAAVVPIDNFSTWTNSFERIRRWSRIYIGQITSRTLEILLHLVQVKGWNRVLIHGYHRVFRILYNVRGLIDVRTVANDLFWKQIVRFSGKNVKRIDAMMDSFLMHQKTMSEGKFVENQSFVEASKYKAINGQSFG